MKKRDLDGLENIYDRIKQARSIGDGNIKIYSHEGDLLLPLIKTKFDELGIELDE
jgi:hypothetical protein